jgi:hypothetical protein
LEVYLSFKLILILLGNFISLFFFISKRKKRQRKDAQGESADASNTCHTVLEPKTDIYELADNSKLSPEGVTKQSNETEITEIKSLVGDDIYNHLREVVTSDDQPENIYDHSTQRDAERDESLYDVTENQNNVQTIPDPTYSHISSSSMTTL